MNKLNFIKGQGGVPKTLPGEDHISGLLMYLPDAELPTGFSTTNRIQAVSTIEKAEALGITADAPSWPVKALHYHLGEENRLMWQETRYNMGRISLTKVKINLIWFLSKKK